MNCRRVVNMMSAYIDGELTGVEMLEIRRHLNQCDECAEEHEAMRLTKHVLSSLENVSPRKDFAAAIVMHLDEVQVPYYLRAMNKLARLFHGRMSPVATALAASGIVLVILSSNGFQTVPQEDQQASLVTSYGAGVQQSKIYSVSDDPLPPSVPRPVVLSNARPDTQADMSFSFASIRR